METIDILNYKFNMLDLKEKTQKYYFTLHFQVSKITVIRKIEFMANIQFNFDHVMLSLIQIQNNHRIEKFRFQSKESVNVFLHFSQKWLTRILCFQLIIFLCRTCIKHLLVKGSARNPDCLKKVCWITIFYFVTLKNCCCNSKCQISSFSTFLMFN